jgi:hypothetical protein
MVQSRSRHSAKWFGVLDILLGRPQAGRASLPERQPRFRPCFEVLEDRTVPSYLNYGDILAGGISAGNIQHYDSANPPNCSTTAT